MRLKKIGETFPDNQGNESCYNSLEKLQRQDGQFWVMSIKKKQHPYPPKQ